MAKSNDRRASFSTAYSRAFHIISIFIMTGAAIGQTKNENEKCLVENEIQICQFNIPAVVHNNILEVYIKHYDQDLIHSFAFDDNSWSKVKSLTIEVNKNKELWFIDNRTFQSLDSLTRLTVHSVNLEILEEDAFLGLSDMIHLNLAGSIKLQTASLLRALQKIRSIQTLILDELGTKHNKLIHIGPDFLNIIYEKGVQNISLSKANLYVEKITKRNVALPLREVNISFSQVFFQPLDLTATQEILLFSNVRVIDISGIDQRFFPVTRDIIYVHECRKDNTLLQRFIQFEQLYTNNINIMDGNITGIVLNVSLCHVKLKVIQLHSCGIRILNLTTYFPHDNPLIDLDLSKNGMKYFSIKGYMPVSTLDLAYNNLYQMQTSPEFSSSMYAFPLLEDVNFENNGFTGLPKYIFLWNKHLKYIRLGGNLLTKIDINIENLHNLKYLDMRNNRIKFIYIPLLVVFDNLQNMKAHQNRTPSFDVNFKGNEIECSCENSKFVEWIVSKSMHSFDDLYHVSCHSDGRKAQMIDTDTLKRVNFLCKRTLLIVVLTTVCVVIVIISFATVLIFRRRRSKENIDNFIKRFKNRKTKGKFLALISHSKDDGQIVYNGIRQHLERAMRKVVPVDFDLLCLGDIHFRPGMAIIDEIYKAVSESCVAIFVISRAFCESSYCRLEIKEAYAQSKPIILMFLEEVDTEKMTPLVRNIFNKQTRVRITREHDNVTIVPSWDSLTYSIIQLTVNEPSKRRPRICFI